MLYFSEKTQNYKDESTSISQTQNSYTYYMNPFKDGLLVCFQVLQVKRMWQLQGQFQNTSSKRFSQYSKHIAMWLAVLREQTVSLLRPVLVYRPQHVRLVLAVLS